MNICGYLFTPAAARRRDWAVEAPKRLLFYKHLGTDIYNDTGLLHGPSGTGKTPFYRALKVITNSIMLTTMVIVINFMQVAIQLTGEPRTFTQGILVDVNSQSLCSKVLNLFLLHQA